MVLGLPSVRHARCKWFRASLAPCCEHETRNPPGATVGFRFDSAAGTDESSEAVLGASGQSDASAKAHPKGTVVVVVVVALQQQQ